MADVTWIRLGILDQMLEEIKNPHSFLWACWSFYTGKFEGWKDALFKVYLSVIILTSADGNGFLFAYFDFLYKCKPLTWSCSTPNLVKKTFSFLALWGNPRRQFTCSIFQIWKTVLCALLPTWNSTFSQSKWAGFFMWRVSKVSAYG